MNHFILLIGLFFSSTSAANVLSVDEVVSKSNHTAYYQGADGKAKVKMQIFDAKNRKRTREFTILRRDSDNKTDDEQKFYVYFHKPADVNKTAFMVWKHLDREDDRWLYLPALDLVKRIAASDERTSFVGSHFFYEDVSGRNPDEDSHELVEENESYYILKSTPKKKQTVEFSYYKNWIHKETFVPVKTEFYDAKGKVYRVYEALKVDTIAGFPTVTQSKMSDTRIGGYTTMDYSKVNYNLNLPEKIFTERYLRNAPRRYLR